ncbi:Hypothetical predicted protein [Scomber scombrus]|uniref:Uncharacterized protein n=1 Tax=Scomber scombrus TaxID=13677 RepID=A0AAV1P1A7_SCOSC
MTEDLIVQLFRGACCIFHSSSFRLKKQVNATLFQQSAVCQSLRCFSREEFLPVIHPSCGRLHGQLKKNRLARPKRGDHMLQHDLPSTLPSSTPRDLPSERVGGHGACRFFRAGAVRKTRRLKTNKTISPGSDLRVSSGSASFVCVIARSMCMKSNGCLYYDCPSVKSRAKTESGSSDSPGELFKFWANWFDEADSSSML